MALWTFLTNHSLVLSFLSRRTMITARELSLEIGITERAIRKIIADLEKEGYIVKKKEGRRVRYSINPRIPLRHKTQRDKAVGQLLDVLSGKAKKAPKKSRKRRCKRNPSFGSGLAGRGGTGLVARPLGILREAVKEFLLNFGSAYPFL